MENKQTNEQTLQVTSAVNSIRQGYELDRVGGCFGSDDQRKAAW